MKLILCLHVNDRSLYINYVVVVFLNYYSGRTRTSTLVATCMTTYVHHRLIMKKVEINIFSASIGIFGNFLYRNVY